MAKFLSSALIVLLAGCGYAWNSANTKATYQITPDGKFISYESNKEQQGLDLDLTEENGKIKSVKIHVDRAGSLESIVASMAATQAALIKMLQDLALATAAKGAGS